jgi:hypothetical protein
LKQSEVGRKVLPNHLLSVLRGVVHSVTTSRDLSGVSLYETGVDGIGHGEGSEVTRELLSVNFVSGVSGGTLEGLGGVDFESGSFVGDDGNEFVEDNLDLNYANNPSQ